MSEPALVEITDGEAGRRVDAVLAERLDDLSRSRLQALLTSTMRPS